jgi:hypothetical protein
MVDSSTDQQCRICSRAPARTVTIRRHVGMIFLQRFVRVRAPLCRDCGVATVKSFTAQTMWQGWWGFISFFANLFTIAANLGAWLMVRNLPEPRPAGTADPVADRWRSAFGAPTGHDTSTAA